MPFCSRMLNTGIQYFPLLAKQLYGKVWSPIFGILYLCYNPEKEFLPQFQKNTNIYYMDYI